MNETMDTTQYEEDFQKIITTIQEKGCIKLKPWKVLYAIRFSVVFFLTCLAFYSTLWRVTFGLPAFIIFGLIATREGSAFTGLRNYLILTSEYIYKRGLLFKKTIYWKDARFFHLSPIFYYPDIDIEYFDPSDTHIEWTHQERITKFEIIGPYGMNATKLAALLTRLQIYYTRNMKS